MKTLLINTIWSNEHSSVLLFIFACERGIQAVFTVSLGDSLLELDTHIGQITSKSVSKSAVDASLWVTTYPTWGDLPLRIKPQPYGALRTQVTFRAAFIAVTAALQSERAWVWSPLQSAWRTHRKTTLAGRPGGRDRALSTRMSGPQTERAAMAERTCPGHICQPLTSYLF